MSQPILDVNNLSVTVDQTNIVDHVSFNISVGEIVALVGGSGSGKSTIALSVMGLLPQALDQTSGNILFDGKDVTKHFKKIRGTQLSMIFQEPLYAFNPVMTIGTQINEVLQCHTTLKKQERQERISELLIQAGIDEPARVAKSYPHQLSGGMRQRAMIAQAVAVGPKLLIADEPTSNLDVTLQAKIIEVFRHLRDTMGLSILLITHDLGMVKYLADRAVVLQNGQVVEEGLVADLLAKPQHELTKQLVETLT